MNEAASAGVGPDDLQGRLADDERLDVLLVRALQAAAESGPRAKRRLLGQLVNQAIVDDARIDESELFVGVLSQIDALT